TAKGKACWRKTAVSLGPLARAVVINSDCSVFNMPSRIIRAILPEKYNPRVTVGRIMYFGETQSPTGKHCQCTAKTMTSIGPRINGGTQTANKTAKVAPYSLQLPLQIAV